MLRVFVYGTLKPGERYYDRYCAGKVVEEKPAFTLGKIYHLPIFGYPAVIPGDGKVQGYLLTFAKAEFLQDLDGLEDYLPDRSPKQNLYNRREVEIYDRSGVSQGLAWVYFMTEQQVNRFSGVALPSGWWTGKIYS